MDSSQVSDSQRLICDRFGVRPYPAKRGTKIGIAENARGRLVPINGLRHSPEGDTNGWYIWRGNELSKADDFFVPLHVEHIEDWCPEAVPYLALPPGWRFLIGPDHEDVWFDETLLRT